MLPRALRVTFVMMGVFPWALPFLRAWLPLGVFGEALDGAFVTMCHRIPARTLVLAGVAMPICSRCAGIFAGLAVGALVVRPVLSARTWRWVITAGVAAMSIDVLTQDLGIHPVWHATRLASGAFFGYAVAVACLTALRREAEAAQQAASGGVPAPPAS